MGDFLMPSLGADMDRGTVSRWLVQPGDAVHRGDIVAVVETEKADVEIEVFEDGTVEELLVPEGASVDVGDPLARIAANGGSRPSASTSSPKPAQPRPAPAPAVAPEIGTHAAASPTERAERARVSPRARRMSSERSVDVAAIAGTGPAGAVTGGDVERATVAPPSSADEREVAPRDRERAMRTAIARAMTRSKREIPHYYLSRDIDFSIARAWLEARNEHEPPTARILPAALLLKATALAAREVPECNGHWVDDEFQPSGAVHLGVAISLRGGGLVAPAIHDADERSLDDLMGALRDLVQRARRGSLRASELSDPTLTVTNLGENGADVVFGVIYPPQVALVGFGAVTDRVWAHEGMFGVRPVVTATLAADHRASDGARGARLLELVDRRLAQPEAL